MHAAGIVQTLQQRWLRAIMICYEGWWKQWCHHLYGFATNYSFCQMGQLSVIAVFRDFVETRGGICSATGARRRTAVIVGLSWRFALPSRFAGQPEARGVASAEEGDGGSHRPVADAGAQSPGAHQLQVGHQCRDRLFAGSSQIWEQ